jgi:hypothetical protein
MIMQPSQAYQYERGGQQHGKGELVEAGKDHATNKSCTRTSLPPVGKAVENLGIDRHERGIRKGESTKLPSPPS